MDKTPSLKDFEGSGVEVVDFLNVQNIRIEIEPSGIRESEFTVIAAAAPADIHNIDMFNVDEVFVLKVKRPCGQVSAVVDARNPIEYRVSGRDVEIRIIKPTQDSLVLRAKRLGTIRDFVINHEIQDGDLVVTVKKVDKPLYARIGVDGSITIHRNKK